MMQRPFRFGRVIVGIALLAGPVACGDNDSGTAATTTPVTVGVETAPLGADEEATFEFIIPYGTGLKVDAGQLVDIMPRDLPAKVGDSIRIVNQDVRDFMIGPFFVGAKKTLAMRFTREGVLSGTCDMNPEGEIVITVTA
ncbi:MAG TPA: hypothetical protein DCR14_20280 [Acidimicrobiaceae bacterium]|nr:hypothetical protein [Acidimicrobiaceae bacterium]